MMNFKNKRGKGGETGERQATSATSSTAQRSSASRRREVKRKILVVAKRDNFTAGVVEYAVNLAQRLGYDIIAMNANPILAQGGKFFSPYNQHMRGKFTERARVAWSSVAAELESQGIHGEHVVKFDDLAEAIKELNHTVKRIDFVITDAGIQDEEITGEIPLPVFSISGYQGEQVMAKEKHETGKGKMLGKVAALGVVSAALYAAVFTNSGTVMKYFTKGGVYAALPIATVFVFSFVHGSFASNLWSLLGIEARTKKTQTTRVAAKRPQRKRPRPQIQLNG